MHLRCLDFILVLAAARNRERVRELDLCRIGAGVVDELSHQHRCAIPGRACLQIKPGELHTALALATGGLPASESVCAGFGRASRREWSWPCLLLLCSV